MSYQAGADILPLKDAFGILFFLAVGMIFNLKFALENATLICTCLVIILFIKPLTAVFTGLNIKILHKNSSYNRCRIITDRRILAYTCTRSKAIGFFPKKMILLSIMQ